jgi:hypothetical protein
MRRKYLTTPESIKKRITEGRGQGRGSEYEPWHRIQDVPSQGLATRILGWKTEREHHFLSKLELLFFFILEWSPTVQDIREQYPLSMNETLAIAQQLGVRHATDPHTNYPVVMTTDFLITIHRPISFGDTACTIKYSKALSSVRVMEKFEIERLYWKERGIKWGIVTEKDINPILARNVEWIHSYKDPHTLTPLTQKTINHIESNLSPKVVKENAPLCDLTNSCDEELGLPIGSSLMAVRYFIATRRWQINMSEPIQVSKRLLLTDIPEMSFHQMVG